MAAFFLSSVDTNSAIYCQFICCQTRVKNSVQESVEEHALKKNLSKNKGC